MVRRVTAFILGGLAASYLSLAVAAQGPSPAQIQAALRAFIATPNIWTALQTFNAGIVVTSCTGCSGAGTITGTLTAGQVPYATGTNTIASFTTLTYQPSQNKQVVIAGSVGNNVDTITPAIVAAFQNDHWGNAGLTIYGVNGLMNIDDQVLNMMRVGGTWESPTAVAPGGRLGQIVGVGWTGASFAQPFNLIIDAHDDFSMSTAVDVSLTLQSGSSLAFNGGFPTTFTGSVTATDFIIPGSGTISDTGNPSETLSHIDLQTSGLGLYARRPVVGDVNGGQIDIFAGDGVGTGNGGSVAVYIGDGVIPGEFTISKLSGGDYLFAVDFSGNVEIANGAAIRTDTTDAHTACFASVYDVNGATYRCAVLGTVGDAPSLAFTVPTSGTLTVAATSLASPTVTVMGLVAPTNKPVCFDASGNLYAGTNTAGVLSCP